MPKREDGWHAEREMGQYDTQDERRHARTPTETQEIRLSIPSSNSDGDYGPTTEAREINDVKICHENRHRRKHDNADASKTAKIHTQITIQPPGKGKNKNHGKYGHQKKQEMSKQHIRHNDKNEMPPSANQDDKT